MNSVPDSDQAISQAHQEKRHLLAADALRGIAILMVVIYHSCAVYYLTWNGWLRDLHPSISGFQPYLYPLSWGWSGVALFFVLSGFCIHLSFLRSPSFKLSQFFWRRFWRIAPAYYAVLFFCCFHWPGFFLSADWKMQIITHLLFIHNFSDTTFFAINTPFWSLGTEIQLYCLFPFLLLIRKKFGIEGCLAFTLLVGMAWRVGLFVMYLGPAGWKMPDSLINPEFSSPLMTWFDWTLGAFVAERLHQGRPAFHYQWLQGIGIFLLFVLSTFYKPTTILSFSLSAIAFAIALDYLLRTRWHQSFSVSILAFLGVISYSLYLWHIPLMGSLIFHARYIGNYLGLPGVILAVSTLLIVTSYLSFQTLERGGIRVGAYLWKRAANIPATKSLRFKNRISPE